MSLYRRQQAIVSTRTVVLLAVTLGALILGTAALRLVERELIARAGESLAIGAVEAADRLDAMFRERKGDVEILAADPQLRGSNVGAIRAHLETIQRAYPVYARLTVTSRAGLAIASTDQALMGRDLHQTAWFQSVLRGPEVRADVVRDRERAGGELVAVVFSSPIKAADGTFVGAITAEVDQALVRELVTKTVQRFAVQTQNFGSVDYRVVSSDGMSLLSSDEGERVPGNLLELGLSSVINVVKDRSGYVEEEHLVRHVPVVTGYAHITAPPSMISLQWGVLVRSDRDRVLVGIRSLLVKLGLAGLGGFIPMLAVLLWTSAGQRKEQARSAQVQQALADGEARTQMILDNAMDAVIVMDRHGLILSWNKQAEATFGWSASEVIGQNLGLRIVPPQHRAAHEQGLARYLVTGEGPVLNQRIETTALRKNGSQFPVELTVIPLALESGILFSAFVRDIMEHKHVLEQLKARETFFRQFTEQLPVGVFEVDETGACLFKNRMWDVIMDRTSEEIFGFASVSLPEGQWTEWFHPDDRQGLHDEWMNAQASLAGVRKECRLDLKGQTERWVQVLLWPLANDQGIRFLGTMEDITAQKQMMTRLRESEMFFRLLSEHLPIGVFEIDEEGSCRYTNKTWNTILRKDAEEIFGFGEVSGSEGHWLEWFHSDDRQGVREAWEISKDSFAQVRHECRLAPEGSDVRWVQVLLWPLASDKGFRYLGTVEDITARKRTIAHTMQLLRHGRFELQTLSEARNLAELLAYAFPDPSRTQLGLTELLVNGVEHGNLEISYAEKSSLLEEGRLDDEMTRRLALPENIGKRVCVSMERSETELEMTITDDGKGFDWHRYLALDDARADDSHGRGIAMSRCISFDRLEYQDPGNQVTVSTRLAPDDLGTDEAIGREAA